MPSSTHRGRAMAAVQLPLLVPLLVWVLLCIAAVAGFASAHASSGPTGPALRAFAAEAAPGPADPGGPSRGTGASARPSGAVQVLPAPDAGTTGTAGTARAGRVTVRAGLPDGGPSCDPGPAGPDRTPSAPARAGGHAEQGIPAASRSVLCGGGAPCAIPRALLCVRGPDRAAPGPVELSVMRV